MLGRSTATRRVDSLADRTQHHDVGIGFHADTLLRAKVRPASSPIVLRPEHPSLLRELIIFACKTTAWTRDVPNQRQLLGILLHQLQAASLTPLQLARPLDPRAARVAEKVLTDPGNTRSLTHICEECGVSKRTIERLFIEETQLTLGRWRQQARLFHAIRLIASGEKIISAAMEAGYNSPSAFIVRFKKLLGCTPSRYFDTDARP
ncbi:MAG: hypothetical protein C5B58_16070 [Acidobacteria bacterium]|nr:MAG: hypothetical protein C5B58_16070 [Acidobacteriota bacterium]